MRFETRIKYIDEPKSQDFFPKKFSNEIYWSSFNTAEDIEYESCFSIKFSYSSSESYIVNGHKKLLKPQTFLLVNDGSKVISESAHKPGEALSIFLDQELISEVLKSSQYPSSLEVNTKNPIPVFFLEEVIRDNSPFLNYLNHLSIGIKSGLLPILNEELYFKLAEQLLSSHLFLKKRLESVRALRQSTRLEIYRRTNLSKQFLEENYSKRFDLKEVAQVAAMSQYHFSRCFKDIYGLTPQQYHSQVRIDTGKALLRRKIDVTEVADLVGYHDLSSFSKKFKSLTGVSPSLF